MLLPLEVIRDKKDRPQDSGRDGGHKTASFVSGTCLLPAGCRPQLGAIGFHPYTEMRLSKVSKDPSSDRKPSKHSVVAALPARARSPPLNRFEGL